MLDLARPSGSLLDMVVVVDFKNKIKKCSFFGVYNAGRVVRKRATPIRVAVHLR